MDNQNVIEILKALWRFDDDIHNYSAEEVRHALEIAINALQKR